MNMQNITSFRELEEANQHIIDVLKPVSIDTETLYSRLKDGFTLRVFIMYGKPCSILTDRQMKSICIDNQSVRFLEMGGVMKYVRVTDECHEYILTYNLTEENKYYVTFAGDEV